MLFTSRFDVSSFVLCVFMCNPVDSATLVNLFVFSCMWLLVLVRRAISSANSRSSNIVKYSILFLYGCMLLFSSPTKSLLETISVIIHNPGLSGFYTYWFRQFSIVFDTCHIVTAESCYHDRIFIRHPILPQNAPHCTSVRCIKGFITINEV